MITMKAEISAISVLIVLVMGIVLNIPSETDVAESTVETLQDQVASNPLAHQVIQNVRFALEFVKIAILLGAVCILFAAILRR